MEEKKETLLNSWSRLKVFVYNYPWAWFMIGFFLALATFPLHFFYDNEFGVPNPFRSLLVFVIIFSFSIIDIIANYDKNRSKFKWLLWDCLASTYLLCCSFGYLATFYLYYVNEVFPEEISIVQGLSLVDYNIADILFVLEDILKRYFGYTPFIARLIRFRDLDGFFIFIPVFIVFIVYDIYKKKTIKEILRTRCFLILFMLSLSRILFIMAALLQ